ncbi:MULTISPECIES: fimbrial protein [unclassified Pantoea]|uniref:fimbrial protein n=1 Tax=unclassified Pantoea TaxID=2630326 RepID=UPI0002FD6A33|nr:MULTISPECIES: fimbrial protein [unclassified Pantoea]MDF2042167.1 fimbrial protein [Pantoea sp. Cr_R14]MDF2070619.1 fimbrial protein [Pantoea sp. Cr_R13]MDF2078275.1 fimbrial protein [Pantoea sp. Cr_R21]
MNKFDHQGKKVMKKHLKHGFGFRPAAAVMLTTAMLSGGVVGSAVAASDPVAIKVTGSIVDNTCTINKAQAVELSPVSLRDFEGNNSTLGFKVVDVELKECGTGITRGVKITTAGNEDPADPNRYAFKNADTGATAAKGIGLRFYKAADGAQPFKVNDTDGVTNTSLTAGDNTLSFGAAYVVTNEDTLAAGSFSTTVNLTLAYQ